MQLFDTHCHLQDPKLVENISKVLKCSGFMGINYLLCCGTQESDWNAVAELANLYPSVIPAFGLHPWFLSERSEHWLTSLEKHLTSSNALVGEAGLDHALDEYNKEEQANIFIQQLELSISLKRAISIHCRKAWGALYDILKSYGRHPAGIVIHSYSGSIDFMEQVLPFNVYFSFSGSITHPKNKRGQEVIQHVPDDRILLETDAPDIPPYVENSERIEINEPANLIYILTKAAELRGVSEDALAKQVWENSGIFRVS